MLNYLKRLNEKRFIFFEIGLIVALSLVLYFFNKKFYTPENQHPVYFDMESDRLEEIDLQTPSTSQRNFGPPPPDIILKLEPLAGNIQTVLENTLLETQLATTEILGANDIALPASAFGYQNGGMPGEKSADEAEIFVIVEVMPEFPGGSEALLKYLATKIRYPDMARENRVEGLVVEQFIIDERGKISGATLLRGIGAGCDEEAIRVINAMPDWRPGLQRGMPVKVRYNVPVRFVLKQD